MKKTITFVLLALFCICGFAQTIDPVLTQEMRQRSDDEKIKVIVIMKSQYDRQQLGRRAAHFVTRAERREFVVNELKQFAEASQYELRSTLSEMERQDMTTEPKVIWMANALYFSATKQAINDLSMRRDIALIGLDEEKHVLFDEESTPASNTREITSNVTQVNADQVWNLGYTGQGVVVAVIDSGVNYNHLDLADHLWDGGVEYPHHGYDFCNNDNDPMDDNSHGTHCAGTVCGDGTAGQQTGMAPDATLMCVKVLDSGGYGSAAVTCNAMQWAVEQGCDLFSMSLGWANATLTERELFRNICAAILDAGVIGAIAAGNEGSGNEPYNVRVPGSCPPPYMDPVQENNPGGLSCALCVGAVDYSDYAASFTSRGPVTWMNTVFNDYPYAYGSTTDFGLIRPDVCAPGVDIISAYYIGNNGYTTMSGTSMATPCMAGCISLLLSKKATATPEEICQVLEETAVPLAEGKSNTYGFGRVDVLAAINALYSGPLTIDSHTVSDGQGNNDGKLNAGESVTLNLTLTNDSDLALDGATMVLSTESEYVTITDGSATLPHFDAGQTRTINNMFAFSLSADAPSKRNVQFLAETYVGGEMIGAFRISVMVYGHILKFTEVTVLNDNNGNSSLEPGETGNLHVTISNVGNDPATSVVGALSTSYPYLTINSNNKSFGSINVDGQASANYSVTLSNSAPQSYSIGFGLDLVDAAQKHTNVNFELWRKSITLTSNPAGAGTLTGAGYYGQGQSCTITAEPNNGYAFVSWTLNDEVVSYLPTYTFEVTGEANYVANFKAFNNSIFIGDGSTTNYYLPSYSWYRYTLSQQIFTAEEMNTGTCQISNVSFFNTEYGYSRNLTVYLVNTDKASFENGNDWITVSEADQVFSGTVAWNSYNWTTVYFDTPFNYNGTSNLALIIDDNTGSYTSSMSYRVTPTESNQSIYVYSDYTNYDPFNPTNYSGTCPMVKDQVVFGKTTYGYTVSATANPTNGGTVSGGGNCYYGQSITLTTTPNNGYVFNNWTKNGEVVSYLSTYQFNVLESATYVANFQQADGIAIGDATSVNSYLPTYYYYSLTEQIYTAEEMGGVATDISYVSFYNTGSSRTRNMSVYMVYTDKTSFENDSAWIAVSESDLVFSGSVTLSANGWTNVYFGNLFHYDGVSNVALVVDDNSNNYNSYTRFRTFDTDTNQAIRIYGSGLNYDPYAPGSYRGTLMSVKNQVVFGIPHYDYTVTSTVTPANSGTVSGGGGNFYLGQSCTLTATPNPGYGFYYWKENGTIKSYDPVYTFPVTGNMQLEANFGEPFTVTVSANPTEGGTVSGSGEFGYNQQCTLTATPNEGYVFSRWLRNGSVVSCLPTYTFSVTSNGDYVAQFMQLDDNSIAIGEPTGTNSTLPTYSYYPYSLTQQIYTANELNRGTCEICSLTFFNTDSGPTRNFDIYMVNTDKLAFENETDWIAVTEADRVFSGVVSVNYRNWTTIYFNTPFQYDGYSNVALIVDDNSNEWNWGLSCRTFETDTTQAISICGEGMNYNPMNPNYSGTLMSVKNQVIFGIPSYEYTLSVSAIPTEGGTVSGGGGLYFYGQPVTISASPNEGYVFNNWTRYNEDNGYDETVSYYSTDQVPVLGDVAYMAHFEQMDGIIIGEAQHTSLSLPSYTDYPYTMSQQIFTAEEMNSGACSISSVSFYNTGYDMIRNLNVYMVNTNKTKFNNSYDWINVTEADLVLSGEVEMYQGWVTIFFSTPFDYDGTSNVALIINDNTGEWNWGMSCRTFDTDQAQAMYVVGYDNYYGDYYVIDPYNPNSYSGTLMMEKNQVVFGIADFQYTVTLTADPAEGGTVSGGEGLHFYGQPVTITATPNEGYVFDNWTRYNEEYGYDEDVSYFSQDNLPVLGDVEYVAHFQQMDGIVIGEAEHTNQNLPAHYYYYSMTQQIYTADEMNSGACEISSVSFFNTEYSGSLSLDIFMVNTSKSTFNGSSDWIPVTENDKFFSGSVSLTGYGWTTIYFSTPFSYDGSSNVALVVNKTNQWNYTSCRTFDAVGTQTLFAYSYNNYYDPYNLSQYTGELLTEKNQVVFGIASYDYTVTVSANPTEGGTVSGGDGVYYYGQPIIVSATANEGYVFNNWMRNNTVLSYLSTDYVSVTEAANFVANFEQKDGIIIGDASYSNLYLPTYANTYNMSQQIYTAEEMGGEATEISSVSFFNTTYSRSRTLDVYMVHTNKTSFESNTDWIAVTEADLVYSGSVTFTSNGWATIYFDTPFNYNGSSNVALVVDDNTYSSYTGIKCRTFSTEQSQAIYIQGGSSVNFDPYNPEGYNGTLLSEKNQVVFGIPSYDYTVTVSANPSEGGTVSGGGGPYYYGKRITISATPAEGYVFTNWTKNGTVVSYYATAQVSVTESAEYVANFQQMDGIIIGDAVASNSYLPMYYYYSLTEQIYTASEMGGQATEISSVSFFNTGTTNVNRKLNVYMVNTDKTSFGSTTDWIPVTDANLVFSGSVAMTNRSWVTIYFNTPFAYDGTSNVALIVDDNSNSYNSYTYCRTFNTDSNQAIRISGSGNDYDPYNPQGYAGTLMSMKNQVVFGIPTYEYTLSVTANPEEGGTVSGAHEGLYFYGQPVNLTATPNEDYVFNNWTKNGEVVSYLSTVQVPVTGNLEYVANFQKMAGIVVGDATSTNSYLPTYPSYQYSLSEQIYTADELGNEAAEITSISFFNTGTYNVTRNLAVYMVHTNKTAFASPSDWISVTEANQVFSGNVTMTAKGWTTIVFNNSFQYNGTSNIALIVDDNSNNWSSSISCRSFGTDTRQAIYCLGYDTDLDPAHPSVYSGSLLSVKNQMVFHGTNIVTVSANPTNGGTVSGSGSYAFGSTCTVTATPRPGYYFLNWTENDVVVSYDAAYSFNVNYDTHLVANFVAGWSTCAITFDLHDSYGNGWNGNYLVVDYGDGSPEQLTLPSGSSISYTREVVTGSNITLSWITGSSTYQCSFDIRFDNGVQIYHGANLNSSFQKELTINCAVATAPHTITASIVPEEGGTVVGAGTYDGGTAITLTAIPNEGYEFCYWAENGVTVSTDANYAFTVIEDRNLVARFSLPINVSATANLAEGGTIVGDGVYYYGNSCTLTATPNEGYLFLNWSKNGVVVSCSSTYSFTVTEDADFEAVFMLLEGTLIGSGETTNSYLPTYSYYPFNLSQQIYTPDEIGEAGSITSISYYNAGGTRTRSFDIYLVHTDKSTFDNNYDWITVSADDLVFSGSVTMTKGYWTTITLDTPFAYNGTSNLVVVINDNTGSYSSSMACRVFNSNGYQSIRCSNGSTNYDPANPSGYNGSRYTQKNQIILGIASSSAQQTFNLTQGWNWWSTYLEITLDDLKSALVAALPNTEIVIKSQTQNTSYNPNNHRWTGQLNSLDLSKMYMIKVASDCEFTLYGETINSSELPVTINFGNNWIGFPLDANMSLTNAFAGFAVNGDKLKSQTGNSQYTRNRWQGQLNMLEPGKGFIYNSNIHGIRVFVFPTTVK